jgi:putative ABC transport system permease protein
MHHERPAGPVARAAALLEPDAGAFALFALLLASVGVYAVISYLVVQSKHEVGLRVAWARPGDIIRLVISQGMGLPAAGIFAGLAGAAALTRLMSSLLFGIRATDAATFLMVSTLLAATAFLATVIPACPRDAGRSDCGAAGGVSALR